jgi:hypothetical protein
MLALPLPRRNALLGLDVMSARLGRRSASHRKTANDDLELRFIARDLQAVVDVDEPRRLHALPVDVDEPSGDRVRRLGSALEEADAPQPFVHSQAGPGRRISIVVTHARSLRQPDAAQTPANTRHASWILVSCRIARNSYVAGGWRGRT